MVCGNDIPLSLLLRGGCHVLTLNFFFFEAGYNYVAYADFWTLVPLA